MYGFVCAAATYLWGIGIKELAVGTGSADKGILFHPSPWLGLSFIGLMLFVVVFTNVRARGVYSIVLLLLTGVAIWGVQKIPGIQTAYGWVNLLRVHLNLAFYLTFSVLLMTIWFFVIFLVDRFTWWRFSPGQVIEEHRVGQATGHAFNTEGMIIQRLPDDLFRHRVLGFGTGRLRGQAGVGRHVRDPQRVARQQQAAPARGHDRDAFREGRVGLPQKKNPGRGGGAGVIQFRGWRTGERCQSRILVWRCFLVGSNPHVEACL